MITRKQWADFVENVRRAKKKGLNPHIDGQAITFVGNDEIRINKIITPNKWDTSGDIPRVEQGKGVSIIYKFAESFDNYTSLDKLYTRIELKNVTLKNVRKLLKK